MSSAYLRTQQCHFKMMKSTLSCITPLGTLLLTFLPLRRALRGHRGDGSDIGLARGQLTVGIAMWSGAAAPHALEIRSRLPLVAARAPEGSELQRGDLRGLQSVLRAVHRAGTAVQHSWRRTDGSDGRRVANRTHLDGRLKSLCDRGLWRGEGQRWRAELPAVRRSPKPTPQPADNEQANKTAT